MKIGILAYDNGEFDQYVGYFDDAERLGLAVERLNRERLDREHGEMADASVWAKELIHVPEVIDEAFLDLLAGLLNEDDVFDIESYDDRVQRLAEEILDEEDDEPIPVSPGQVAMSEMLL